VLGGFLTWPSLYRPFVRRLRDRGASAVVVADVWTPDWLLASVRGSGPIATRSGRALLEASRASEAASLGAPLLVVGHSAGGLTARVLTSPVPFAGRRQNGAGRIGAIVTLGTPHLVARGGDLGRRLDGQAAGFANRVVPGACFAPRIGYVAVSSRLLVGRRTGTPRERVAWLAYRDLLGDRDAAEIDGDGLVPVGCALLPGAASLVFDDVSHGQWPGRDWYGSDAPLDRWWPLALDAWHGALRSRVAGPGG
jgi:hypothetical protein